MEDLRQTAEDRKSEEEARKKTKKIGSTAVEAKPPKPESKLRPNQQPEHIGQMLVNVESKPGKAVRKTPEHRPLPVADKRVATLNRTELLNLSESIVVDGSSLRQIYETHLIGERGLRRLVGEHLRGGDLKKALRLEVIEREIDFERDPGLRDMMPDQALVGRTAGASNPALDELLQKATISVNDDGEETAFFKARAMYEANQLTQHKKQRRVVDISVAAAIIVLMALVIFLYLSRK